MYNRNGGNRFGDRNDRQDYGSSSRSAYVPVKVGDVLSVTIEAVGEKGDGVAKKDGFVLFVPGTKTGQTCQIRVTKVFKKVGFAEVVAAGTAQAETQEEGSSSDAPAEEAAPAESAESSEDSEDFGSDDDTN